MNVLYDAVLNTAVVPILKGAGFRKSGTTFHRRHGETVQVVNFQGSGGSTANEKTFYVNVGLAFDAICELVGLPILERVKEHECDERGTRDRLESLVENAPADWVLQENADHHELVEQLTACIFALESELNCIEGLATYRMHPWFERFRPTQLNAQILYLLGELGEARREVEALCALFADRPKAVGPEWWIDHLRLAKLKLD